jgi:spore germination cell wall hydrolase CwlJ-like protein
MDTLAPADAAAPQAGIENVTVADTVPVASAAIAAPEPAVQEASARIDSDTLDCMAKVVHHEARNQPRAGQIAVAQTLINRIKAGRFGETVCAVANQHGQFFNTGAYHPNRETDTWTNAVDVSRAVLRGDEDADGMSDAVYFRAAYRPANAFFKTRQRLGAIGDHVFYR